MVIAGISIMALVVGLVEFGKKFGLQGKGCIALAMVLGVAFGALSYAIEQSAIPTVALPYVEIAIYGLAFGLASAGLYDLGKKFSAKS